jgi:hypothetical protein
MAQMGPLAEIFLTRMTQISADGVLIVRVSDLDYEELIINHGNDTLGTTTFTNRQIFANFAALREIIEGFSIT